MNISNEWIKQTNELIEDWETERQELHDKYDQLANQLMDLETRIQAAHELVNAYVRKYSVVSTIPINSKLGNLANKTYPEMLIEIAKLNNGIINVPDVVTLLFNAKVGTSEKQIQHSVYNVLSRWSDHFSKIERGKYRFTNNIHIANIKKQSRIKPRRDRNPSGVKNKIRELKKANPQWTKKDMLNHLLSTNFDFKGKNPINSVNMSWASLGYSLEEKQPTLPGVTFIEIPQETVQKIMPERFSGQAEQVPA
jgi:hypothetical protein